MSYLYANRVNDRILCGNLPHRKLERGCHEFGPNLDLATLAKPGLSSVKDSFIPLYRSLQINARSFESLGKHIPSSINLLINTGLNPELADIKIESVRNAILLQPYITTLDKALWCCIINLTMLVDQTEHESIINELYAWLYIFSTVQENEKQHKKTLNIPALSDEVPLFDILCNPWKQTDDAWFVDLTHEEACAIDKLFQDRKKVEKEVQKDYAIAQTVAEETEAEWCRFLEIVNDLSSWEYRIISRINRPITNIEKLESIGLYNSIFLHGIACDHYFIDHTLIRLPPILEAVERRMQLASAHCICSTADSRSFRLREEIIPLFKNPKTFNYLFISYHQFRMDSSQENAMRFSSLALAALKRNLGCEDDKDYSSIDDIAQEFFFLVEEYVNTYSDVISELRFNKVQQDSIIMGGNSLDEILFDNINDRVFDALATISEGVCRDNYEAFIEEMLDPDKWQQLLNFNSDPMQLVQDEAIRVLARQIVVSLNIIYLFCDALRIMLKSNSEQILLDDKAAISSYRDRLLQIQKHIANQVYIDDVDLDKYREETGIDALTLTEQEAEEDQNRNNAFMEVFNAFLEELFDNITRQSVDDLFAINKKFRDEILQCPICSIKERYALKLDATIAQICSALVDIMKADCEDFEKAKQGILLKLGDIAVFLPPSSLNTLATAELLYQRYAIPQFVQAGFDYSCISSLYYQAFEDAYNTLIWYKYAVKLNDMTFGPHSFSEILFENQRKQLKDPDIMGYLSSDPGTRNGYLEFNRGRKRAYVRTSCMYKLFATIMEQVKPDSDVKKFCNHFAKLAGYRNSYTMLSDSGFMERVGIFTKTVDNSVFNRNNASHGGSPVSMDQCLLDKQTVLSEIATIRENSIGLIQQLLYLLKDSKTLPKYNH